MGRELLDPATHLFTTARYNACPTIRYMPDGFFCKPHATHLPEPHVCTTFCRNILHKSCLHEHDGGISSGTVAIADLLTLFSSVPPGGTYDTVIVRSKDLAAWDPGPDKPRIVLAPENAPSSPEHSMMPGSTLGKCGEECARWSGPPSWQIVRGIR